MVTVMTWGNSEGTQGRCDDRCHSARTPDCACMCRGRYHGANHRAGGLQAAVSAYEQEVLAVAQAHAKACGLTLDASSVGELFGFARQKRLPL